jgi:hypothetical protein
MQEFSATITKVGINPCVEIPQEASEAFGRRGNIPVSGTLNGLPISSTLVPVGVGDTVTVSLDIDPEPREIPVPKELQKALEGNPEAKKAFNGLTRPRRRDILAYLNSLKRKESLERNVKKVLDELDE